MRKRGEEKEKNERPRGNVDGHGWSVTPAGWCVCVSHLSKVTIGSLWKCSLISPLSSAERHVVVLAGRDCALRSSQSQVVAFVPVQVSPHVYWHQQKQIPEHASHAHVQSLFVPFFCKPANIIQASTIKNYIYGKRFPNDIA